MKGIQILCSIYASFQRNFFALWLDRLWSKYFFFCFTLKIIQNVQAFNLLNTFVICWFIKNFILQYKKKKNISFRTDICYFAWKLTYWWLCFECTNIIYKNQYSILQVLIERKTTIWNYINNMPQSMWKCHFIMNSIFRMNADVVQKINIYWMSMHMKSIYL